MRVTNKRFMIDSYQKQNCEIMYKYVNYAMKQDLQTSNSTHTRTGDDSEFYVYGRFQKQGEHPQNGWFRVKILEPPPKK